MPRKFLAACVACVAIFFPAQSSGFTLPDLINEWHSVGEYVKALDAGTKNFGKYICKSYARDNPIGELQIILTEGRGTGNLYVPDSVKISRGLMPSEATYKILNVSGHNAILENQSYLSLALSIAVDDNITLTIESFSLNESEIVEFAQVLLAR